MIFRIKHHWPWSLVVTLVVAAACVPLGGWDHLLNPSWPLPWQIFIGVLCGGLTIVIDGVLHTTLTYTIGEPYLQAFHRHGEAVLGPMQWPEYVLAGIMAAFAEEPLFRGIVLHLFENPIVGVLVASLVFAACHWLRREFFPFWIWAMGEGLLFGILMVTTGSLLVPMIAHGIHDTVGYRVFQSIIRERQPA